MTAAGAQNVIRRNTLGAVKLFIGCICLASILAGSLPLAAQTFGTILTNGPASNRFNIVFLSEGYTTNQLPSFRADAAAAAAALLARSPFAEYQRYFNVFTISVASLQAGSDHPAYSSYRNTYFNSSYDVAADRLLTIPPNAFDSSYSRGQGKIDSLLQSFMPLCRLPVLLVNDLTPGGSDGAGATAITYRGAALIDFLAHESAHVMANLGDEYTEANPGYPDIEEPNTTQTTNQVKWAAWIVPGTPIPTPASAEFASSVGVFEGAHYHQTGWYRPKLDCTMNHPTFPSWCEVCREALVLALYRQVRHLDSWLPADTNLSLNVPSELTFRVTPVDSDRIKIQWLTNGVPVTGATNATFNLPAGLQDGTQFISARATDPTLFVRNDPAGLLVQNVNWRLQVTRPALRLDSPALLADGRFICRATGAAPSGFIMQSSSNLENWDNLSTNFLVSGELWLTNLAPVETSAAHYRAWLLLP